MCKCGCNTCDDNKAPIIKEEKKGLLSEGLEYHLNYNIPLSENIYRIGSEEYCKLFQEARKLYNKGLIEVNDNDKWYLTENVGELAFFEGRKVILDTPFEIKEAEYQGKQVDLNKPKRGGAKKFYVYVKTPSGKIKKVSFGGTTGLKVKLNDPKRRKAFADRHNCKDKKDKTKPGYWSCNLPRYAYQLGLGKNMNTFW